MAQLFGDNAQFFYATGEVLQGFRQEVGVSRGFGETLTKLVETATGRFDSIG